MRGNHINDYPAVGLVDVDATYGATRGRLIESDGLNSLTAINRGCRRNESGRARERKQKMVRYCRRFFWYLGLIANLLHPRRGYVLNKSLLKRAGGGMIDQDCSELC